MHGYRDGLGFVGRAIELSQLQRALDRARSGRGTLVIVTGEAGIGKTRLIERFTADAASSGARVLAGACLDVGDGALPYGPFVEALRGLIRSTEPGAVPALLGPGRDEMTRLLPELAVRAQALPQAAGEFDRGAQGRLFELVLGVVERTSRSAPVVLVVEDLQWADRATRDLLAFLARGLRDDRVLLLVSARTEELGPHGAVLAALAELERDGDVERIELARFDRDELVAQLRELDIAEPAPEIVDRILERSDGNPFFVEQLVASGAHVATALPPRLRDVLEARLAGLDARTLDVLRVAAAAGRRVDDLLVAGVLGVSPRALADAFRTARASGVLAVADGPDGRTYTFRHALLQEFVAAELLPGERTGLHRAFARALEARAARGDGIVPAVELARHWDAAHERARALPALILAARDAEAVLAFADALPLLERALELWPTVAASERPTGIDAAELHYRAAEAAVLSGGYARAVEHGRAALAAIDATADPPRAGFLQEKLRWYLWEAGDRDAAAAAVHEALALLPVDPPSEARARALAHLAGIEMYGRDFKAAVDHARQAVDVARAAGARGEEALALGVQGWATAALGGLVEGIELFRAGMAIAEEVGSIEGLALAATNLASLLDHAGRSAESLEAAQHGYQRVSRLGVGRTYGGLLLGYAAKALLALGRWDEAEEVSGDGLRGGATGRAELWLLVNRARILLGRGRFDDAARALQRAAAVDAQLGESEFRTALLAAAAELAVWRGRPIEAREAVDAGLGREGPGGPPEPSLAWLAALGLRAEADVAETARARRDGTALAEALRRGGRIQQAIDEGLAAAGDLARQPGRGVALALLMVAERARLARRAEPPAWAAVAEAWVLAARPFPVAYARYRETESILAQGGPRATAEAAAQASYAIANRLGAEPLKADLLRLARQGRLNLVTSNREAAQEGELPADEPLAAYDLTPREAEVLRLVAGGWTNQQIADALFITRKTASVHVSNILAKLGVHSRVEVAVVAHRIGLGRDAPPPPDVA